MNYHRNTRGLPGLYLGGRDPLQLHHYPLQKYKLKIIKYHHLQILEWVAFSLLQRIFPTQESNQGFLHCRQILYQLSYQGSPNFKISGLK